MDCRSERAGWWRLPPNHLAWLSLGVLGGVQWMAVSWTPLASLLGTVSLSAGDWGMIVLSVLWPVLVIEALKVTRARVCRRWNRSAIRVPSARSPLRLGKLPPALLDRLLRWRGARDDRVLVGPGCGEDAAVVRVGRRGLVLKSDPVTFTTKHLGWYVVQVNANDLAVIGARPCWFQPTILLPPAPGPQCHRHRREH